MLELTGREITASCDKFLIRDKLIPARCNRLNFQHYFRSYSRLFLLFLNTHTIIHAKTIKIITEIILAQTPWIVSLCPLPGRYRCPVKSPITADMKYMKVARISVPIKQPPSSAPAHRFLGGACFPCSTDSGLVADIGLWYTSCLMPCSTSAKNVSTFFLFFPNSHTC